MIDFEKVYFRSKAVGRLSSQHLKELKETLTEIESKKQKIAKGISNAKEEIKKEKRSLSRVNWFPVRLFFKEKIKSKESSITTLENQIETLQDSLSRHQLGIEVKLTHRTESIFATLCDDFSTLSSVGRIWDITTSQKTDRVAERTTANNAIERSTVSFSRSESSKILSDYKALHLGNANGSDLNIYPQFILIENSDSLALLDLADINIEFGLSNFIEEESLPSDAVKVGQTWKKSNKDGSRDKRFTDNYQIPIVQYGQLHIKSDTGLNEVYMFSAAEPALKFKARFDEYKNALSKE